MIHRRQGQIPFGSVTIWTQAQPRAGEHPGPEGRRKPDDFECCDDGGRGSDSSDGPKKKPSAKLMTGRRRDKATKTKKPGDKKPGDKKPGDKTKKPGEKKAKPK